MSVIPILYEDEHMLVVCKPAGLVMHFDGSSEELSLVDWFVGNYPGSKGVGEPIQTKNGRTIDRSGVVHRLDRDTSGAVALAKTSEGHTHLKAQFNGRRVQKTYRAFVYGSLKADSDVIDRPIGRSKNDFRKWTAMRGVRGELREAITSYSVLGRNGDATYIDAKPKTGRTHQIRVHMKAINHPVICDSLYAETMPCLLGFSRLALHSLSLEVDSMSGERILVCAELPFDFKEALKSFSLSE